MDTVLHYTRRMAHNSSPSSSDVMKYSPTDSLKMNSRDNKRIERRKPNWTESENVFLLDQFAMHREILTCKATDASTNLRKQEIWRLICANLNQNNTLVRRTPAEVRRKWKNLVTAAKKEVWEMRHQMHISGGSGTNGRKISELSQRVLQLHSSGNINNQSNGIYGNLLSAGLLGNAGGGGDKFASKYADYIEDKSFIPAHFTPIITLSESNNNHIISGNHGGDGFPSPMMSDEDEEDQESSDSRNATEFMSDSGVNEQEGMDLRVNVSTRNSYASSNSRSGRSHLSGTVSALNQLNQLNHHREALLARGADLGDEDDELLDDDEEVELAMAAEKRYANYNGQLTNGGTITKRDHHHGHGSALANFHHSTTNGPSSAAAAAAASVLLERQHLQHLQQLANAASLRPALNTSNSSSHNSNNTHQSGHNNLEETTTTTTNLNRKCSESTEEISPSGGAANGDIFSTIRNASSATTNFLKLKNHFAAALQESDLLSNLYKERLQLQIEVLKLRKEKLSQELSSNSSSSNGTGNGAVKRPKIVRCGLRLLKAKNVNMSGGYPYNLYRARLAALHRFRHYNNNHFKDGVGGVGGKEQLLNGGLELQENHNEEMMMSEEVNGDDDEEEEEESEVVVPTAVVKSAESVVKKESEGKCLVNGDSEGKLLEVEESAA